MKTLIFSLSALLLTSTAAISADMYQPQPEPYPPIIEAPEVTVGDTSGWYLRGDLGYNFNRIRGANFYQGGNSAALTDFTSAKLKDSLSLGAGVGYQVNNYLRTDLTFDYMFKSDFRGSTSGSCGVAGACTSTDISSVRVMALMANAYVDLGTYGYVTPYVGAGIGGAYVKWRTLQNTSCETGNPANCDNTEFHGGKNSWRFAYQLMAGATIDVTCNIKADAGYRYRHINGGDMFGYVNNGGPGFDKGIDSHELRIGARYQFTDCAQPVAYEPPPQPIVYK